MVIFRKRGASTRNFKGKQEFIAKVRECLERGFQKFHSEMRYELAGVPADIPIVFIEKGRNAGCARYQRALNGINVNLEFNIYHIENYWDDMVEDTVPHEVAHVIDYMIRGDSNHDGHWQYIARSLGCTGNRTHNYEVKAARKTQKFIYVATCGSKVAFSKVRHNRVQSGTVYTLRRTGGKVNRNCVYIKK
jgi:predicted SprT family Zn-dependent metalloprotease